MRENPIRMHWETPTKHSRNVNGKYAVGSEVMLYCIRKGITCIWNMPTKFCIPSQVLMFSGRVSYLGACYALTSIPYFFGLRKN